MFTNRITYSIFWTMNAITLFNVIIIMFGLTDFSGPLIPDLIVGITAFTIILKWKAIISWIKRVGHANIG